MLWLPLLFPQRMTVSELSNRSETPSSPPPPTGTSALGLPAPQLLSSTPVSSTIAESRKHGRQVPFVPHRSPEGPRSLLPTNQRFDRGRRADEAFLQ